MSSHLIDTSDEENCVVALSLFISDLLDEGQVRSCYKDRKINAVIGLQKCPKL